MLARWLFFSNDEGEVGAMRNLGEENVKAIRTFFFLNTNFIVIGMHIYLG